jgi:hypothetical protein
MARYSLARAVLLATLWALLPGVGAAQTPCAQHVRAARALLLDQWLFLNLKADSARLEAQLAALQADVGRLVDPDACADAIRLLLASLGDGHLQLAALAGGAQLGVPAALRLGRFALPGETQPRLDAPLHVLQIDPSLPGIRPGDEVLEIDGVPGAERLAWVRERTPGTTTWGREYAVDRLALAGPLGAATRIRVRTGAGEVRDLAVGRHVELPLREDARVTSARLPAGQGSALLIRVSSLADAGLLRPLRAAFHDARHDDRVVLDLRGVTDGDFAVVREVARLVVQGTAPLALLHARPPSGALLDPLPAPGTGLVFRLDTLRARNLPLFSSPYRGELVLLVDAGCFGPCEALVAGLRDRGRAVVVGSRTGGSASSTLSQPGDWTPRVMTVRGTPHTWLLARDWSAETERRYQVRIDLDLRMPRIQAERLTTPLLEGSGVVPDVEVAMTLPALVAGRDPVVERALLPLERVEAVPLPRPQVRRHDGRALTLEPSGGVLASSEEIHAAFGGRLAIELASRVSLGGLALFSVNESREAHTRAEQLVAAHLTFGIASPDAVVPSLSLLLGLYRRDWDRAPLSDPYGFVPAYGVGAGLEWSLWRGHALALRGAGWRSSTPLETRLATYGTVSYLVRFR